MSVTGTSKSFPVHELAVRISGEVVGDGQRMVTGLCSLDDPQPGCLTFLKKFNLAELHDLLLKTPLAAILVPAQLEVSDHSLDTCLIKVRDPQLAFMDLVPLFFLPARPQPGISQKADVHPSVRIGKDVNIGAFSSIGENCSIGDQVTIHANVTIYPNVTIGNGSTIHAGAVVREDCIIGSYSVIQNGAIIGSDGFGYVPDAQLGLRPVPQVGIVRLADRVDVGANSCIDRATIGTTDVGASSKIDNLVQVGHNCKIGRFSILCGLVGLAGSCKIGDRVTLAGHTGVADHINIASGIRVGGKSGVISDLTTPGDYAGYPAVEVIRWRRISAVLGTLPETIRLLKKALKISNDQTKS